MTGAHVYKLTILTALARKTTHNWNYSGSVYCWSNRLHKCTLLPLQDTIMCTQTTQKVSFDENHTMSDLTVCRHYEISFTRLSPQITHHRRQHRRLNQCCHLHSAHSKYVYNILRCPVGIGLGLHCLYCLPAACYDLRVSSPLTDYGDDQTS